MHRSKTTSRSSPNKPSFKKVKHKASTGKRRQETRGGTISIKGPSRTKGKKKNLGRGKKLETKTKKGLFRSVVTSGPRRTPHGQKLLRSKQKKYTKSGSKLSRVQERVELGGGRTGSGERKRAEKRSNDARPKGARKPPSMSQKGTDPKTRTGSGARNVPWRKMNDVFYQVVSWV